MLKKIENKIGKLVYKRIEELQNFQGDLKELSPESYERLKTSFMRHGNIAPMFIWERNILDGQQRTKTLLRLKDEGVIIPETPCVEIKAESEKEAKRFLLQYVSQHGRVTEDGLYAFLNEADLQDELEELKLELDLPGLDLEEFCENFFTDETTEDDKEDEVPEIPREARSKMGDLYELGEHRVLCGDATKVDDVNRLTDGKKADMVFTDPPYNIGYDYWDYINNKQTDEYKNFCLLSFNILKELADRIIITTGHQNIGLWTNIEKPTHICAWIKKNATSGCKVAMFNVWEPIFFYGEFKNYRKRNNDIFEINNKVQEGIGIHKCPKQVSLLTDIIHNFSDVKNIVVDVFLGSGTTLIGCVKTGRICYGIEMDPHYIDVIVQRYVDYTQNRKIKLNGHEITWENL